MSSGMKKAAIVLVGIIAIFIALVKVIPMLARQAAREQARPTSLSQSAWNELEVYLNTKSAIVAAMPSHPLSDGLLQDIVAVYQRDLGVDQNEAQKLIAERFRNSNLGLYALKRYLSEPAPEHDTAEAPISKAEYCEHLCRNYPNARISSMAMDHLLESAADNLALCDQYVKMAPHSRLGVFARIRKGDAYRNQGQDAQAALCYLQAWQKEPARGKRLYNKLYPTWLTSGDWTYPTLMAEEYLDSPILNGVKARALSEMRMICEPSPDINSAGAQRLWNARGNADALEQLFHDGQIPVRWRAKAGLILAKSLLDDLRTEKGITVLQDVLQLLSGRRPVGPECVDLCIAASLLQGPTSTGQVQPKSVDDSLAPLSAQAKLSEIQEAFLELAEAYFDSITPDERTYYASLFVQYRLGDMAYAAVSLKAPPGLEGVSDAVIQAADLELRRHTEQYLEEKNSVLLSMPSHPLSGEVLREVVSMCVCELGVTEQDALKLVTERYPESNLGLYALREYLSRQEEKGKSAVQRESEREFCEHLCISYPNARIGSMAFDHLWKSSSDKLALCDRYIQKDPDSRLGVFALIRKGDTYRDRGQVSRAALCYLEAWQKEPTRGKRLYNELYPIWLTSGDWTYPALMAEEYLDNPILNGVKARALSEMRMICEPRPDSISAGAQRLWNARGNADALEQLFYDDQAPVRWRAKAGLILAKSLFFDRLRTEEGITVLQDVLHLLSGRRPGGPECVDLCIAASLLQDLPFAGQVQPESVDDSLALLSAQMKLSEIQEAFFELAEDYFDSITPDEQSYYFRLVAQGQLMNLNPLGAVWSLKAASKTDGQSPALKTDILRELARLYVDEWSDYSEAGRVHAEIAGIDPNEKVRFGAGVYHFLGGTYDEALLQFEEVLAGSKDAETREVAQLMIGACHSQRKHYRAAVDSFQTLIQEHPNSHVASRAWYLQGSCLLQMQQYVKARECFQELVERYPDSGEARQAERHVARLNRLAEVR